MLKPRAPGRKSILLAAIILCSFLGANIQVATANDSGCVTCHIDKEMLQKTAKVEKGAKSAMQSGAG
jgi:hypothetical protein